MGLEALDPAREWYVAGVDIEVEGPAELGESELRDQMSTKTRPWYAPWRSRPVFDPGTFEADLARLRRYCEQQGYYESRIDYDLRVDAESELVSARIVVRPGPAVTVSEIEIDLEGEPAATEATDAGTTAPEAGEARPSEATRAELARQVPLHPGDRFTEDAYKGGEAALRKYYLDHGHAWVDVGREARVLVEERDAEVCYEVTPGPRCFFGESAIQGTENVDPELVRREIAYRPGEGFSQRQITRTRDRLLALGLFDAVQITPDKQARGERIVPMTIRVGEGPPREIRAGITYNTQDEIGGQIEWLHRNWLGGGRQLAASLKVTSFNSFVGASLRQPHLLSPSTTGSLALRQDVDNEDTYLLSSTRFLPRLEQQFLETLTGFLGYRLEYDDLSDVDPSVESALGGVKSHGLLSGPVVGLVWNTTLDPLNPQQGEVVSVTFEVPTLGGAFSFYKLVVEGRKYVPIGWRTILAARLKLGLAGAFGSEKNLPLFDRFYAGGEKSVRGYGRRRLGPLSSEGEPLGGLSLFEGSLELRRPIWKALGGAAFVDFGQVSLHALSPPVDSLKLAVGVGLTYDTPVGPVRLDVAFPLDPPREDPSWQLHFSIGQFF